jgi:hypothetical protein
MTDMGFILLEGGAEFGGRMADPDRQAMMRAGGTDVPIPSSLQPRFARAIAVKNRSHNPKKSRYQTTKFLFRSDWALFWPAAGLNAEACNTRRLLKHGS